MNVIKLDEVQKKAIHAALCAGGGIGGAAKAARVDRRTLQKLIEGEEGDTFLMGLVEPEAITREEYEGLTSAYRLDGERVDNIGLRERYAQLLQECHGEELRLRIMTEAERSAELERLKEAGRKLEAEAKQREERRRYEAERAEEERRLAMCEKLYGGKYERLRAVYAAYQILYGTDEEIRLGLGGSEREAERDAYRMEKGLMLDCQLIHRSQYASFFMGEKRKREQAEIVAEVERVVEKYRKLKNVKQK